MGAVLVAVAASIGNLLQGWDIASIAGAVLFIRKEFNLESNFSVDGLVIAMALIGATIVTTFSGSLSDSIGRRPMLIISSLLHFLSGIFMLWSPNLYVLLLARLVDGFGIGLTVTLVPIYISEISESEIRGLLNTLPQFTGCCGMFLSYCVVFGLSMMVTPDWRLMLGVLSVPSILWFALTMLYLPESPRWLVSKGRMIEAKLVLQRLRGKEDVSGEMALLIEGLAVSRKPSIEEYIISPIDEEEEPPAETDKIIIYGPGEAQTMVARPVNEQNLFESTTPLDQNIPLLDPLVPLFASVHEKLPEMGSMRSTLFPNFGSMFSVPGQQPTNEEWDEEENIQIEGEDYVSDAKSGDSDEDLESPLISRQDTSLETQATGPPLASQEVSEDYMGIGGGWHLGWKWCEAGFKRIYFHQKTISGTQKGSRISLQGDEVVKASAVVSEDVIYSKEVMEQNLVGPAMVHPAETIYKGVRWGDLFDGGVKRALMLGIVIQILQQFAGINGVLYYTPLILEQAGAEVLLKHIGVTAESAFILIGALTTLLMLPSVGVAMRLMDISGRRTLLLATIPILVLTLIILIITDLINLGTYAHAALSTITIIIYICFFIMGFGPIPNILCAEIFPTRARGICISVCSLAMWIGCIIVTYTLPMLLHSIGIAGTFGIFGIVCIVSLVFAFLRVPETKGMPLEVIVEFFAFGARN